jgi:CubicO group peptidase (beta-lactamase class C family)
VREHTPRLACISREIKRMGSVPAGALWPVPSGRPDSLESRILRSHHVLVSLLAVIALGFGDGLPGKPPAAVGMSAKRLAAIDRVVTRGIRAGGFPGATVIIGRRGAAVFSKGYGRLSWVKDAARVDPDATIYDLASLTKAVGTTTALMILYDEGRIALDARVVEYLPAFTGGWKDSITIRQLLTHRSGLPASRDLWKLATNPQEARLGVIDAVLQCRPGVCYDYSDLGMVLLGMVVENVTGVDLDRYLQQRIFEPLGMTSTFFRPGDSLRARIAPTDVTPPRGYPLRGEVADENAYALGGVAGHAGLFSTASDISVFAQMMLNGGQYNGVRIVADSTIALFTRRTAGTRALGWDTADGDGGSGSYLSGNSYGHTGYTGTSLWIDPDREMFVVLLTNRVHDARARRPAKVISDVRADVSDLAALSVTDDPQHVLAMPRAFRADKASGWNRPERVQRSKSSKNRRGARRVSTKRVVRTPAKKPAVKDSAAATTRSRG